MPEENLNFVHFILITLIFGISLISLLLWGMIISRNLKGIPLLERNHTPRFPIRFHLVITTFVLYLLIPVIFLLSSDKFPISNNKAVQDLSMVAMGQSLVFLLGGFVYLFFYRSRVIQYKQQELVPEEENEDVPLEENIFIEPEEVPEIAQQEKAQEELPQQKLSFRDKIEIGYNGFLVGMLPVYAVLFLTFPLRTEEKVNPIFQMVNKDPSFEIYILAIYLAVFVAPFLEELVFRVILQGFFTTTLKLQKWIAIFASAIIFAGFHGIPDAFPLVPLALVLGYIYHETRSYLAVVFMHMFFNGFQIITSGLMIYAESLAG